MLIPLLHNSRFSLRIPIIFFIFCPGLILCADVTLSSMEIFTTHEWLKATPTVYFKCKEENKTLLPDVMKKHTFYSFKGEESWQPMTNFSSKKCKRCGLYEEDRLLSDYEFDEWEFCPSDFASPYGKYVRVKENEFNATFLCPECLSFAGGSTSTSAVAIAASDWNDKRKGVLIAVVVLLTVLISAGVIVGVMAAFKYWQKKKREKDQARFLKLFEEGDDIEDELGLGTII